MVNIYITFFQPSADSGVVVTAYSPVTARTVTHVTRRLENAPAAVKRTSTLTLEWPPSVDLDAR